MKRALITGISGQDGSYLAEFLLNKGYKVYGFILPSDPLLNLIKFKNEISFIEGNLSNQESINQAIQISMPDEIYHLASLSFPGNSWDNPVLVGDVNALGTTRLLDSLRRLKSNAKFYHASTSEMFGFTKEIKTEKAPFHPRNPYSISKCFSHWIAVNYRESYEMFICCGISFNHESPRRTNNFVTKKIVENVVKIKRGEIDYFSLGNLDAERDWGYAKEYIEVMWLMLQEQKPDDYIISTGEIHSVREFLITAFRFAGIDAVSNGKSGIAEEYIRRDTGKAVVKVSSKYYRPIDLPVLKGSNSKVKRKLGWQPKTKFEELIKIMMEYELGCN